MKIQDMIKKYRHILTIVKSVRSLFIVFLFLVCMSGIVYHSTGLAMTGKDNPSPRPCDRPGTSGADACEGIPVGYGYDTDNSVPKTDTSYSVIGTRAASNPVVYFFKGDGCPKCAEEEIFLEALVKRIPAVEIRAFEVWRHTGNAVMMRDLLKSRGVEATGIPVTLVGNRIFYGFSPQIAEEIERKIASCTPSACPDPASAEAPQKLIPNSGVVDIPLAGKVDLAAYSFPFVTVVIALLDSFNPCAFFVLLSLLGIMAYARSRKKMLLVGGTFLLFSGGIYFLFMAAWLNIFLVIERFSFITLTAGIVSVLIGAVNIKDFFAFRQGISLSIPDRAKPKLFDRMRRLVSAPSLPSVLAGTAVLAVAANSYELLCTAGFPMVYTRILTLNGLSPAGYYLYLVLYNLIYVIPMAVIVWFFAFTAGRWKLTEWQGRVLKLVSGAMISALGVVLIVDPSVMNNIVASAAVLVGTVGASLLLAWGVGRLEKAKVRRFRESPD